MAAATYRSDDAILQATRAAFAAERSESPVGARTFEPHRVARITPNEPDSLRQPITPGHAPLLVAHSSLDPSGTPWAPWLLFVTFLFVILALTLILSQVITL